jgi:hypothetical protein
MALLLQGCVEAIPKHPPQMTSLKSIWTIAVVIQKSIKTVILAEYCKAVEGQN